MNDLLGVTVEDLVASLKARRIRIPSEIGAFVALETCEALIRGPAVVGTGDVRIGEDGTVSVFAPPHSASAEDAARSVVHVLASLLVAAGTGVPEVLIEIVENGPSRGPAALERLRDDLESSLVPLNRAAARRVLSRMIREAERAAIRADALLDEIPEEKLDEALDDLLGAPSAQPIGRGAITTGDPELDAPPADPPADPVHEDLSAPFADPHRLRRATPAGAGAADEPTPKLSPQLLSDLRRGRTEDVASDVAEAPQTARRDVQRSGGAPPGPGPEREAEPDRESQAEGDRDPRARAREAARTQDAESAPPVRERDAQPDPARKRMDPSARSRGALEQLETENLPPRSGGLFWVFAFVVVGLFTVAGVAVLRPDLVDRALGREPLPQPTPARPSDAERETALDAHRGRFGTLTVRSTPDRAQVLLFVGRGPATATHLPTGMAYEFVAIADGRAPSRAVVPADAQWESTPAGPRYELAIQTGELPMEPTELALGETRLTRDVLGAPSGTLGSVRVVTTPPGAKVYLLVGFTPEVRVQNVRTDEAVEFLVYRQGYRVERVVIGPSDWATDEEGRRTAEISVTLTPTPPQRPR